MRKQKYEELLYKEVIKPCLISIPLVICLTFIFAFAVKFYYNYNFEQFFALFLAFTMVALLIDMIFMIFLKGLDFNIKYGDYTK